MIGISHGYYYSLTLKIRAAKFELTGAKDLLAIPYSCAIGTPSRLCAQYIKWK